MRPCGAGRSNRALKASVLQRDAGRTDRHDRVVLVQGVARAYELLTGKPLERGLTPEQRPTGPGVRPVRLCLAPLIRWRPMTP
jgi:hypothetical protein